MNRLTIAIAVLSPIAACLAQETSPPAGILNRRYEERRKAHYIMKARNNDRTYEVRLTATVKRNADGHFVEEYEWSDLVVDGVSQPLTPASRDFRQTVTLTGGSPFTFPDLSKIQPALIGPVTDLLTFYADLFLAMNAAELREPGDRFFFPSPGVSSWADGTRVLIGEDAIDFDIRLTGIDRARDEATLAIQHVPPKELKIRIPAEWMRDPIGNAPNNWVQVRRAGGGYIGAVGKETFDVRLTIKLTTGEIVSATMDNPVETVTRECADAELSQCGEPRSSTTIRQIEMLLGGPGQ